jgi:hypothetical protein
MSAFARLNLNIRMLFYKLYQEFYIKSSRNIKQDTA